jgi:ATP-dependent Lon protease
MESGVRGLERTISKVMRKLTRKLLTQRPHFHELLEAPIYADEIHQGPRFHSGAYHPNKVNLRIAKNDLFEILGEPPVPEQINIPSDRPGFALGLYYSEVGGGVVPVEVALFKGKGKVTLTGSLGDVMKESAQIAHSYLKSIAADWGIDPGRVEETDVHIHCPEGAMPKDGPSAGITMITALLSAFLDKAYN